MSEQTTPQLPSYLRPIMEAIKAEIERQLTQRGISSRSISGSVVRGVSNVIARVGVRLNTGATTYQRRRLNLIEGAGVTLTVTDDPTDEEVDVTLAAAPDASVVTYTPAVATDWDGDADPGNTDDALDQLAERTDNLEAGASADVFVDILVGFDNGTTAIAANAQRRFSIDFAGEFVAWTILAAQSGAIKIDLWACAYADYDVATHPVDADSICGGHEPEIAASATKAQDTAITDWSGEVFAAGTCFVANVDSCTTITEAVLVLKVRRA